MATASEGGSLGLVGVHSLRSHWGWILALGIAMVILGFIALGDVVLLTLVSVAVLGWLFLVGGVIELIHAFRGGKGSHKFLHLLMAIAFVVAGILLLLKPGAGAIALTLALSIYFVASGVFRILYGLSQRLPGWGWIVFSGVISLLFGVFVLVHWPSSGLWVIGMYVAIDLMILGWSRIMLALALRKVRA